MTTEEQRQADNMLLQMIQRHFPSIPLSDRYTDWPKWLGFARAAYDAGRAAERDALAKHFDAEHGGSVLAGDEVAHEIRARSNAE